MLRLIWGAIVRFGKWLWNAIAPHVGKAVGEGIATLRFAI